MLLGMVKNLTTVAKSFEFLIQKSFFKKVTIWGLLKCQKFKSFWWSSSIVWYKLKNLVSQWQINTLEFIFWILFSLVFLNTRGALAVQFIHAKRRHFKRWPRKGQMTFDYRPKNQVEVVKCCKQTIISFMKRTQSKPLRSHHGWCQCVSPTTKFAQGI